MITLTTRIQEGATRTALLGLVVPLLTLTACDNDQEYDAVRNSAADRTYASPTTPVVHNTSLAADEDELDVDDDDLDHDNHAASDDAIMFQGVDGRDAIRLERIADDEVRANEVFQYKMRITNVSEFPVYNVTVHEMLPEGVHIASAQGSNSRMTGSTSGSENYSIGMLSPGASSTITVEGIAQTEGDLQMCLGVQFDQGVCTTLRVVKPQLDMQVATNATGPMYICDDLELTYVVTNVGSGVTDNATIQAQLPEGLTYQGQRTITLDAGELEAGATFQKTITIDAETGGEFSTFATASTGNLTVRTPDQQFRLLRPELDIWLDGPSIEFVDRPITYTLNVRNVSDDPAIDTVVRFPSTDGMNALSVSTQAFDADDNVIEIGDLAGGETRSFDITFTRDEPGEVVFAAEADAYCTAAVSRQLMTQVNGIPAVRIEAYDTTDPVAIGETAVYEIRVKNQGSARDLNLQLVGTLPSQMTFLDAEGDSEVTADGQTLTFASLPSLGPGETAMWIVRATVNASGKAMLQLKLTSDATNRPVIEQEPTNLFDNRAGAVEAGAGNGS